MTKKNKIRSEFIETAAKSILLDVNGQHLASYYSLHCFYSLFRSWSLWNDSGNECQIPL